MGYYRSEFILRSGHQFARSHRWGLHCSPSWEKTQIQAAERAPEFLNAPRKRELSGKPVFASYSAGLPSLVTGGLAAASDFCFKHPFSPKFLLTLFDLVRYYQLEKSESGRLLLFLNELYGACKSNTSSERKRVYL